MEDGLVVEVALFGFGRGGHADVGAVEVEVVGEAGGGEDRNGGGAVAGRVAGGGEVVEGVVAADPEEGGGDACREGEGGEEVGEAASHGSGQTRRRATA